MYHLCSLSSCIILRHHSYKNCRSTEDFLPGLQQSLSLKSDWIAIKWDREIQWSDRFFLMTIINRGPFPFYVFFDFVLHLQLCDLAIFILSSTVHQGESNKNTHKNLDYRKKRIEEMRKQESWRLIENEHDMNKTQLKMSNLYKIK